MDLKIVTLSKASQTESNKYHIISLICGIYICNATNRSIYKTEIESQM